MGNGITGGPNSVTATKREGQCGSGLVVPLFSTLAILMIHREEQGLTRERFHCINLSDINFERVPSKGNITEQ